MKSADLGDSGMPGGRAEEFRGEAILIQHMHSSSNSNVHASGTEYAKLCNVGVDSKMDSTVTRRNPEETGEKPQNTCK